MGMLCAFLIIAFLAGMAGAFQLPTLSLYLSAELKVDRAAIGLFYVVNAAIGIGIGFWLATVSDRIPVRRRLLMFCYLMAIFNSLIFAFSRQYLFLLIAGSLLAAVANSATPQLFALAREHSVKPMFSALMRAQLSLAWVLGPPLAFSITAATGFTAMYMLTAGLFTIILLLSVMLPVIRKPVIQPGSAGSVSTGRLEGNVWLLFVASVLMWSCSALYLIDIPLFVTLQLGLSRQSVGLMMGLAAAIEIPVMLLVGRYVERLGKKRILGWALYAGIIFYNALIIATSLWQLLFLQFFNAVFIGVIATVGMFFFQVLLPGRQGLATTLFTNSVSVGIIFAGVLHVFLTENGRHEYVYVMAGVLLLTARVILRRVNE